MSAAPILLVDDHLDSRVVFSTILRHHGYAVLEALDGDEALRLARTVVPGVVVTDLNMPGLDGVSLIHALKLNPATASVPSLVVTADTTAQGRLEAQAAGCSAFLLKPLLPRELVAAVRLLYPGEAQAAMDDGQKRPGLVQAGALSLASPRLAARVARHENVVFQRELRRCEAEFAAHAAEERADEALQSKSDAVFMRAQIVPMLEDGWALDELAEVGISREMLMSLGLLHRLASAPRQQSHTESQRHRE